MAVDLTHPERPSGPPEMSGSEMKSIRKQLGLSTVQLARAIGYAGADTSVAVTIRTYESDRRPLPPWIARLLVMYGRHGVPDEYLKTPAAPE